MSDTKKLLFCLQIIDKYDAGSFQRVFWEQQQQATRVKSTCGMRWDPLMIRWCLYLRHLYESAYELVHEKQLMMLSPETLQGIRITGYMGSPETLQGYESQVHVGVLKHYRGYESQVHVGVLKHYRGYESQVHVGVLKHYRDTDHRYM